MTDKRSSGRGPMPARLLDGGTTAGRLRAALQDLRPQIVHIACGSGWSFREAAVHAALARRAGARVVLHLHAASLEQWWHSSAVQRPLIRRVLGAADAVAVLSPGIRDWLAARGVPAARLWVVPNGVPVPAPRVAPTAEPPLRLLVVGSVEPRKGVQDLIAALRGCPPAVRSGLQVRWIGPEQGRLGAWQARAAGLPITFTGAAPPDAVQEALRTAHALLLPSRREGLPFALLEAMAVGVPVLATDTGAIGELLEGGAGVVVPPAAPAAITAALQTWVGDPTALLAQGEAGRARILARHGIEHTMQGLDAVWTALGGASP